MLTEAEILSPYMHCILLDPPGSGESSVPEGSFGYSAREHGEWYAECFERLGIDEIHLVGASFGGLVGLEMVANELIHVKSLVCISTPIMGPEVDASPAKAAALEAALEKHASADWYAEARWVFDHWTELVLNAKHASEVEKLHAKILPLYCAHPDRPDVRERLTRLGRTEIDLTAMKAWEAGAYQSGDARALLPLVRCPTFFIRGEYDWMATADSYELARREIRDCSVTTIPDCGHLIGIEAHAELTRLLGEWFSDLSEARGL